MIIDTIPIFVEYRFNTSIPQKRKSLLYFPSLIQEVYIGKGEQEQ